ncbi:MAG: hypothetical protein RR620_08495 [Clostridium sp.]
MAKELVYNTTANSDGGNSSTKVIVGGSQATIIENYRATRTMVDYRGTESEYAESQNGGINCLHLKVTLDGKDEREFLFGDMAKNWDSSRDFDGIANKHNNNVIIENSIASVAACFAQNVILLEKEKSENIRLNVALSVGLPVLEYGNEDSRDEFTKRLKGVHLVEFLSPYFHKNGIRKITVNVERIELFREGEAALNSLARFSEHPIITDEIKYEYDGKIVSGIDLGKGSTDGITATFKVLTDSEGNEYQKLHIEKEKCLALRGVSRDYKEVMLALQPKDTENELTMISIEQALKRKPEALRGKIKELGNEDMLPEFRSVVKFHTDEIAESYKGTVKNHKNILIIYISGGASEIPELVESLKASFIKAYNLTGIHAENFIKKIVTCSNPSPIIANVEGYYGLLQAKLELEGNTKYLEIFAD